MITLSKLYVKPVGRNCYKQLTVFLLDQKALERFTSRDSRIEADSL